MTADRLFDLPRSEDARGKDLDALANSRDRRDEVLRLFGGDLPTSIMKADRGDGVGEHAVEGRGYKDSSEWSGTPWHVSGQSVRSGALSIFPQNIGRAVTLLYSKPGDLVLDPFAGHNSRMELCTKLGRRYEGYDVSRRFMELNLLRADELRRDGADITLHLQDAREMVETTGIQVADFTLTSPPYWDLEDYGDEAEQLGRAKHYRSFLNDLGAVASANFRCLKPGRYAVWFINDFRKDGRFYPFHADVLRLLTSAGFLPWDVMVVDLGAPIRAAFASQVVEQRILPKRHEYGIVVRRPV